LQHTRELVAEIVAAYREVREVDREAARVNASAPLNEDRRLRPVEQTARALSHLMGTCSILDEMKLVISTLLSRFGHRLRRTPPLRSLSLSHTSMHVIFLVIGGRPSTSATARLWRIRRE